MKVRPLILMAAAAALVAGCGREAERAPSDERPLGSFTPVAPATSGEYDVQRGAVDEEPSPVRPVKGRAEAVPGSVAEAARTAAERVTTAGETNYEARLEEVPLPVERAPVLTTAPGEVGDARLVNTVLATVNDEVITREDILGELRPQMAIWRAESESKEDFEARCRYVVTTRLREKISERLVVQEAKRRLSDAEKQQIDITLGRMMKQMIAEAGSALLFEETLQDTGRTLEEETEHRRERLMVQHFLRQHHAPNVHVTHSELLDRYREVRDERYTQPEKAGLWLITIRKSEFADAAEARRHAEMVRERAASGEDFARLAERYSHGPMAKKGGAWGEMTPGAFRVKAVDEALFRLDAGQVAPLAETDEALHVVKAATRQRARVVPFTEVQDELEAEIRDQKYNQTVSDYIQGLYDRAYVRVMWDNL